MNKKLIKNYQKTILFLTCSIQLFMCSCVEEYSKNPVLNAEVLVVEGLITNQLESDTIEVSYSNGKGVDIEIIPVKNCILTVTSDDGMNYNLKESFPGKYYTPSNMLRQIGKSYKLKIAIPNGETYESNFEKMTTPPTTKVSDIFEEKAILNSKQNLYKPGNKVYIEFQDSPDEVNQYLFKYKYYEQIAFCKTCYGKILSDDKVSCVELLPNRYLPNFDYECNGNCWDILYNNSLNIYSDVYTNGKIIKGLYIGTIPYVNVTGALIEIKQYSISTEVYRFYNLLSLQGQKTGSLTDTPPFPIVGNIRDVNNPQKIIAGCFGAAGVSSIRYFVDRKNNLGLPEQYLGHFPVLENVMDLRRPRYQALCVESETRTKIKPIGWIF
jgi:Domain of unknown function (DUF4249)